MPKTVTKGRCSANFRAGARTSYRSDAEAERSASEETSSAVKDVSCFKTKENKLDIVTSI